VVGGLGAFGDQPFPTRGARLFEVGLPVGVAVLAEPDRISELHRLAQEAFALAQRQPGQVVTIQNKQVEQVEDDRNPGGGLGSGR
jgi:hypothetical protein